MSHVTHDRVPFFSFRNQRLAEAVCWIGFTAAVFSCGIYLGERIGQSQICRVAYTHPTHEP